jgi:ribosomal protein S12 methylthiotransferase
VSKRFYLLPLGCPKNTVDAEGMRGLLQAAGWREMERPDRADLLIVNTCGFMDSARAESYAALRALAQAKRRDQVLLAAGCLSQRYADDVKRVVPAVDGLLGTREWAAIVPYVEQLLGHQEGTSIRPASRVSLVSSMPRTAHGPSAYLKIADGCSARCAFCAIPLIKGPQHSKPRTAILEESSQLVSQGVREIVLIGQDTTAYGRDWGEGDSLPGLISDIVAAEPKPAWLRLMYAYPQHVTARLIEVIASHSQVCHYLDLPLQHAHPETLRRMRRSSDVEGVRRLISKLRRAIPDIALRTAFIVGYPGETEDEFAALLEFMREICFDKVGIFRFSPEQGTPAVHLPNPVPTEVAEERHARGMELQKTISRTRNQAQVGRVLDVLVEGIGDDLSLGRSYRDAPEIDGYVFIDGQWGPGQIIPTRVEQALDYDLRGKAEAVGTG